MGLEIALSSQPIFTWSPQKWVWCRKKKHRLWSLSSNPAPQLWVRCLVTPKQRIRTHQPPGLLSLASHSTHPGGYISVASSPLRLLLAFTLYTSKGNVWWWRNTFDGFPWWLTGKESTCQCRKEMQETWVQFLGQEDRPEKEMATHSSVPAWEISWIEEPGGLQWGEQPWNRQKVEHNRATKQQQQSFVFN